MSVLVIIVLIILGIALYDYYTARDWEQITCVDRINIVFEERNKKYGAYSIRRDYNDLVLFIVLGMIGLFAIVSIVNTSLRPAKNEVVVPIVQMDTTLLTLPAPPEDNSNVKTIPTPYKVVSGGGSGTPDNSKYDPKPKPMMKKPDGTAVSDKPTKPAKGNSNSGKNPNEESSTREKSPFSGSGGKGGGDGKGKGKGLGDDDGDSKGKGTGPFNGSPTRIVVSEPNWDNIQADENCTVYLSITISPEGTIVGTPKNTSSSTTTNSSIINEVIRRVKNEMRFNKIDGNKNQTVTKRFFIKPN